jgi:hypothetical protein
VPVDRLVGEQLVRKALEVARIEIELIETARAQVVSRNPSDLQLKIGVRILLLKSNDAIIEMSAQRECFGECPVDRRK